MIPGFDWQRWLVWGGLILAAASAVWLHGYSRGEKKLFDYQVAQAQAAIPVATKQGETTVKVVTKYKDRIVRIKGDTVELTKEVLVYVKPVADPVLPVGWRMLHDSAATGSVPKASGGVDVTAPDIAASQALRGVIENYGACKATAEQLLSLQEWVRHQYQVANNEPLPY